LSTFRKSLFIVISLVFLKQIVLAATCPDDAATTTVFYVNGVNNDPKKAHDSQVALEENLNAATQPDCFTVALAYNHNELLFNDFFQSARQVLSLDAETLWDFWFKPIIATIPFGEKFADFTLSIDLASYVIDADLRKHVNDYKEEINNKRRKVVAVAHSQGNLYALQAYNLLSSVEKNSFRTVSVATPASSVPGNGPHTTLFEDFIYLVPGALGPNVSNGNCGSPWACHAFMESYLSGSKSGSQIIDAILRPISITPIPRFYNITQIAHSGGSFFNILGSPSINNSGTVAFFAYVRDSIVDHPRPGVFTGNGGPVTTIADSRDSDIFSSFFSEPSINDNGIVAFVGILKPRGEWGIFASNGLTRTTIADSSDLNQLITYYLDYRIIINNQGVVVFSGDTGIFTGINRIFTTIAVSDFPNFVVYTPSINNLGVVAFGGAINIRGPETAYGVFTGNGGSLTTILTTVNDPSKTVGPVGINDHGTVAFVIGTNTGETQFVTNDGKTLLSIVDSHDPPTPLIPSNLNNNGGMAIMQSPPDARGATMTLFTVPAPVPVRVIGTGDALSGSTIVDFSSGFGRVWINNSGQIAFIVSLADGSTGVYRADPVY
jgi:hypothetical protein